MRNVIILRAQKTISPLCYLMLTVFPGDESDYRSLHVTSSNQKPGVLAITGKGNWVKKFPEFSKVGDCKLRFTGFSFMLAVQNSFLPGYFSRIVWSFVVYICWEVVINYLTSLAWVVCSQENI